MNRKLSVLLISALFFCGQPFAQDNPPSYSGNELYTIARCWGLLKYYHPVVSRGQLDWDSVLLAATGSTRQPLPVQQLIANWLAYAGSVPVDTTKRSMVKPEGPIDSIDLSNFHPDWIKKSKYLSVQQQAALYKLIQSPDVGTFYSEGTNNRYSGKNEKIYGPPQGPEYRLLDLFRAWNCIEYFYPYKYTLDHNWDTVLKRFIPRFKEATTTGRYDTVLAEFAAMIDDTHTEMTPTANYRIFGEYGPPFAFLFIDSVAVVTRIVDADACKAANIDVGDVITSADGRSLSRIFAANNRFTPASNKSVKRREVYNYMFNGRTDHVTLKGYRKNGQPFSVQVKRIKRVYANEWFKDGAPDNPLVYRDEKSQQLFYARNLDGIGYIDFSLLDTAPKAIDSVMKMLSATKGLIIDLRAYNDDGGLLKIFDYLLPQPAWFGIRTQPDFKAPGKFQHVGYIIHPSYKYIGRKNDSAYKGKVVVLINQSTQSAEELWAMMFKQVPRVVFVGSQTAGADGNITRIPLVSGATISFSGLGIFYPDGSPTQRIGIKPDIIVNPTVRDIQQNNDPLVKKAIQLIQKAGK